MVHKIGTSGIVHKDSSAVPLGQHTALGKMHFAQGIWYSTKSYPILLDKLLPCKLSSRSMATVLQ